uniref:Uncharacterized protein n=1 Tax=Felis catus TaxID=9685 RepID=A0ABI7XZQ0_FELCA
MAKFVSYLNAQWEQLPCCEIIQESEVKVSCTSQYVVTSMDNSMTSRSCSVWVVRPRDQLPFHERLYGT